MGVQYSLSPAQGPSPGCVFGKCGHKDTTKNRIRKRPVQSLRTRIEGFRTIYNRPIPRKNLSLPKITRYETACPSRRRRSPGHDRPFRPDHPETG